MVGCFLFAQSITQGNPQVKTFFQLFSLFLRGRIVAL